MKHKTVLSFEDLRDEYSRYAVKPRSNNQRKYWELLQNPTKSIVIAHGPAGCGKTLLATQNGIDLLKIRKFRGNFGFKITSMDTFWGFYKKNIALSDQKNITYPQISSLGLVNQLINQLPIYVSSQIWRE